MTRHKGQSVYGISEDIKKYILGKNLLLSGNVKIKLKKINKNKNNETIIYPID